MTRRQFPTFNQLLDNYPDRIDPCDQGREHEWNQCAIRMSIALIGAGFLLTNYNFGPLCRHGHARGAQSLGDYLWRHVRRPTIYRDASAAQSGVTQKTGIVVFKNISGFRGGRGDHIDLWNRTATMTGEYFGRAQQTLFWEIA